MQQDSSILPSSNICFFIKILDAFDFKNLILFLMNNLKVGCFEFNADGIFLKGFDFKRTVLIDLKIPREEFVIFDYFFPQKSMFVNINLNHFYKTISFMKKKDSMILFMRDTKQMELGIGIIPKENNRCSVSYIAIQNIVQTMEIETPEELYAHIHPIFVPSIEFQKMCKNMSGIGTHVTAIFHDTFVTFNCVNEGIFEQQTTFGDEKIPTIMKSLPEFKHIQIQKSKTEPFQQTFSVDQILRISKLGGMFPHIQFFAHAENPLLIKTRIGKGMGIICIYLKFNEIVEDAKS